MIIALHKQNLEFWDTHLLLIAAQSINTAVITVGIHLREN